MNHTHRLRLSSVMKMAWTFYRDARRNAENRPFADCLTGAWKLNRGLAEEAKKLRGVEFLRLSRELISSPIARAHGWNSYRDFHGALITAQLGR